MQEKSIRGSEAPACASQGRRDVRNRQGEKIFTLTVLAAALCGICAPVSAQYVETGVIGSKASWETAEYLRSWGIGAMKASSAYALGYNGSGVKVGVMDSGARATHQEFDPSRFTYVHQAGAYGTSGMRYRGAGYTVANGGAPFTAGQAFDITGAYNADFNDGHGTSVTGVVGADRDGAEMHGISWGSNIIVGNTGATDNNNYGPFQDYQFFYTGWKAVVDAGAQVINNSWGTNIRINMQGPSTVSNNSVLGPDGGAVGNMIPTNTLADVEYEYFYFKKMYGNGRSFVDAAWDAVKDTKVVHVMTTGNRDMANPFHRALYPYFHPEAESHWIAAAGIKPDTANPGKLVLERTYNEAGLAKWWTVVGPTLSGAGMNMYTTSVGSDTSYGSFSGTSCSAPHVAGAMGVLLSRYVNMDATQVRDVLFTTATHKNTDGSTFDYWTAPDGVPDERYGWGMPDLEKGMYGPGQFLGRVQYNASKAPLDVWTNSISQVALDARKVEDQNWLNNYKTNGIAGLGAYQLGTGFVVADNDSDDTNHFITLADAEKWRKEYADQRAASIQSKLDAGLYDGSLVKLGAGTLVMTGDNTYRGGTTIQDGGLYGFTESFGTGKVSVDGGRFGVLASYNDTFTQKGTLASTGSRLANIDVNRGGTYAVMTENNVNVGALTFKDGSRVTVDAIDRDLLRDVYENNTSATGTVTATALTDFSKAAVTEYAFLDMEVTAAGNTITGSVSRNSEATFAGYGTDHNGRAIGGALDASSFGALHEALFAASKGELRATYDSLGSDFYLNADNASIVNSLSVSRSVKNQALGIGSGRSARLNDTARVWATGLGNWSDVDYGHSSMDVDFYAGVVGAEVDVTSNSTVGLFFGAGSTKFKGGRYGKIDSDDLHLGLYGIYKADAASITYGIAHTHQDRDAKRTLIVADAARANSVSPNAKITQIFAEAAYTKLNTETYSVEPYVGLNVMRIKSDGYTETVDDMTFRTSSNKQTLQAATIGVRGRIPITAGNLDMAVTGDISGMHFFGNNTPDAYLTLADSGSAKIRGGKLDNLWGVGLGLETRLSKSTKFNLSYTGAYNGDIKSSGVFANIRISF